MADKSEILRHALKVARENDFAEIELRQGEFEFRAKLQPVKRTAPALVVDKLSEEPERLAIKAPMVGVYRHSKPALEVGATLNQGDAAGIITALSIDNQVEATASGEIIEVLLKDGDPVEYGQVIAWVKP